jgi:hypothetical protein
VEFRLTYEGILLAESNRDESVRRARAEHKHSIRKYLHPQLKQWWQMSPYLQPREVTARPGTAVFGRPSPAHTIEGLSKRFAICGYNFVPLATRDLELFCSVEILLLRQGMPGGVFTHGGDLDNRLKTLFDALTMPKDGAQISPNYEKPGEGETPFFCLLEDDSVITRATVESDALLKPVNDPPSESDVRAIITVKLRPARVNSLNVGFA